MHEVSSTLHDVWWWELELHPSLLELIHFVFLSLGMKRKLTNSDLRQNKTWALPSENLGFMWKDRDNYRRKDKLSLMHNAYTLCCTYFSYTCTVNNSTVKCMMHMLQWTAEWFRTMLITQFPSELRSFWPLFWTIHFLKDGGMGSTQTSEPDVGQNLGLPPANYLILSVWRSSSGSTSLTQSA